MHSKNYLKGKEQAMKNSGIICAGVVIGIAVMLLVGAGNTQDEARYGRYQLAFGKVQMDIHGKSMNSTEERAACMKIDTKTGRVWIYVSRTNPDTKETVQEFFPVEDNVSRQTQKTAETK